MPISRMQLRRVGVIAISLALTLSACGDLSAVVIDRPTPFPTLARLATVTPPRPTATPWPTIPPVQVTPTPTVAPILIGQASRSANIRSGPSTDFGIVGIASEGMRVTLTGTRDGWYQIVTDEGLEGWMSAQVLEIDPKVAEAVPIANE